MTLADRITLRAADQEECWRLGWKPEEALQHSIDHSTRSFLISYEKTPLAYWGWKDDCVGVSSCQAWMLSTPEIEAHKIFAARESRRLLNVLLQSHYLIWVLVDPTYDLSVKWLKWLGFTPTREVGPMMQMVRYNGGRA